MERMRLLGLGALITAELALVTLSADGANLPQGAGGLIGLLDDWGAWIARWIVASGALFGAIAYFRPGTIAVTGDWTPPSGPWLAIHVACATAFWLLSRSLYSQAASTGLLMAWISTGAGTVATAAAALIPRTAIGPLLRGAAPAMLASALAGAAACWLGAFSQRLWRPAAGATFVIVKGLLGVLVGDVVVEPWRNRVGTQRFGVLIAEECSGLEGIALFLAFAVCWLVLFRDELRIGRALAVLPLGVVAVYLANSVRITLLVLIGHAGYRQVAVQGFHSQAGWIGFSLIAFGVLAAARRWSWLSKLPPASAAEYHNPAAPYLVPFLAVIAAGMISGALSGGFEWFYGLRVVAGGVALWMFRYQYKNIDWSWSWLAPAAGAAVYAIWVAPDWLAGRGEEKMPGGLAQAPEWPRWGWIALRAIGGTVVIPLVEELAFRGYLYRRFVRGEFDNVPWTFFRWTALAGSSVLFGLMHGDRWIAASIAGAAYAGLVVWRGRLGDGVAAHAATNFLLALTAVLGQQWYWW